jgi:hypothetical protein
MAIIRKEKIKKRNRADEAEDAVIRNLELSRASPNKSPLKNEPDIKIAEKEKTPPKKITYESKKIIGKLEDITYARDRIQAKIVIPISESDLKSKKRRKRRGTMGESSIGGMTSIM